MDVGSDFQASTGGAIVLTATGNGSIHIAQDLQMKADSNLRFESGSDTSMKAGARHVRDGSSGIFDNSGMAPSTSGTDAVVPKATSQLDTTSRQVSGKFVWKYGGGKVQSIVSRMPTHEPWSGHPNSKVPPPPLEDAIPGSGPQGSGNASNLNPDGTLSDTGCSFGSANTKPISTENFNAIQAASDKVGVPLATMLAFSDIESSHLAGVGTSTSSAKGLYQFTDGTWNSMVGQYGNLYNVSADQVYDPNANAVMGAQFIKNNTSILQNQGISDPTPGQLYIMHFMGSSGGPALIKAAQNNPDADASTMFPAAAAANPSIFSGKTVGQVYQNLTSKADAKATAYANQQGLPSPCERPGATGAGSNPGGTPSAALNAAQSNNGKNGAQINDFLHANGVSLDATQNNWCAAYTNASLHAAGIQGDNSNVATSFMNWGQPVDGNPQAGDVLVQSNGHAPGEVGGHVGIATGNTRTLSDGTTQWEMTAGNTGGRVQTYYVNSSELTARRGGVSI
jgi:uncharacterized protein (TIGR02594 family)